MTRCDGQCAAPMMQHGMFAEVDAHKFGMKANRACGFDEFKMRIGRD